MGHMGRQPRVRVHLESHRGARKRSANDENALMDSPADSVFLNREQREHGSGRGRYDWICGVDRSSNGQFELFGV